MTVKRCVAAFEALAFFGAKLWLRTFIHGRKKNEKIGVSFTYIGIDGALVACGGGSETQSGGNATSEKETENSAGVQVDEGLLNVDVTLAASFFEDQTEEEIKAEAKENGYSDCKINDDGSVTYTMSKKKHAEMLDEMKTSFD